MAGQMSCFSPGAATLVKYSLRVSATKAGSVTMFSLSRRTMLLCFSVA